MPGPIPNREADLARPRHRGQGDAAPVITHGDLRPVSIPRADPEWHPTARRLWDSMKTSGQASFYQNTDWAYAYFLMGEMTAYLNASKRSSMMLTAIMAAMTPLCLTEGDRRRVRIELTEPDTSQSAASEAIAKAQAMLGL